MPEKASGYPEMTAEAIREEIATLVRETAEPRPVGDSVKTAIQRSARRIGISPGRVKRLWYREAEAITALEADLIRRRAKEQRARELTRLRAQIATLEVQQKADRDALAAQLPILLGPLYPMAVKAGLVNPEAAAAPKDGEA